MPHIIYVAGYGRSGSTVLDTLLGNHPSAFGAGELRSVFREWSRGSVCSCGVPLPECPFWQEVMGRLQAVVPGLEIAQAASITDRVEARAALPVVPSLCESTYKHIWSKTFRAISEVAGKEIVVDSSKTTRIAAGRLRILAHTYGSDLSVIHLVRDPRAVMWSILRGSNRRLEAGEPARLPGGALRALLSWAVANSYAHLLQARPSGVRAMRMKYEELAQEPGASLKKLGNFVQVDMGPLIRMLDESELDAGHGVAGNRTRRLGSLHLVYDDEWETVLPRYARWLACLCWPWARRYGYDVLHQAHARSRFGASRSKSHETIFSARQ